MPDREWTRFLNYMEHAVRGQCKPQRETLRGGPFEWLQTISGKVFGEKVGPLIVRFFLEDEYQHRINAGHDFVFRGRKIEMKTGVEHSTPGVFLFEQIRPTQDWDCLLCLGIAARSLIFFTLSRRFVDDAVNAWRESGDSVVIPQHGGARRRAHPEAEPDTFWLWTKPVWNESLEPYRSVFDRSGWRGRRLQDALSDIAFQRQ